MIEQIQSECSRFQTVAWSWLQSGETTRTDYKLSPIEELCGFNYGFVYLMKVDDLSVKIGHSEHPMRRLRELIPEYGPGLKLMRCFVGEAPVERFAHHRFRNLRIRNEIFYAHPIIDSYFMQSRREMQERLAPCIFARALAPNLINGSICECWERGSHARANLRRSERFR